ncbi:MAG: WYL domain-containing protein [Betaproteobacteria bacterium]|nr:WYL domain-containing protein [Betaproteobacteria bacterium]
MDRTERFYRIDRLLKDRGCVPLTGLMTALGVSRATLLRDIAYLRDRLHAPIVFDRERGGYRLDAVGAPDYALPSLWFNPSEIHALLAMQQLLRSIEPGLLARHVEPLERRLHALLGKGGWQPGVTMDRVRLVPVARRLQRLAFFEVAASATLARRRLRVTHHNRNTDQTSTRELSPQRLVYYRDNWYLDAWCHLRQDLRSFAVDALQAAVALPDPALEVPAGQLAERFDAGYGIFSHPSASLRWARLRFSAWRSRWVQAETWHPQQRSRLLDSGELELEVPYHDPRELMGEVLRQGRDCEVLGPPELRDRVRAEAAALAAVYAGSPPAASSG